VSLALRFLCAPYLAWLALRHARRQAQTVVNPIPVLQPRQA